MMKAINFIAAALLLTVSTSLAQAPTTEPITWNATAIKNGDGTVTADVRGKWVNYMNDEGEWKKINTELVHVGDGWETTDTPFFFRAPQYANQEAYFEQNVQYDIFKKQKIKEDPIGMWLRSLDAEHVQGELYEADNVGNTAVIYRNAFPQWNADLIYYVEHGRAPRLEKLIRFNSAPKKDVEAQFLLTFTKEVDASSKDVKLAKRAIKSKGKISFKKEGVRGIGIKTPELWDSDKKRIEIEYEVKPLLGGYVLTKYIPSSFFSDAVLPVYTDATQTVYSDPDAETKTVDGEVGLTSGGGAWTTVRNATSGSFTNDSTTTLCARSQDNGGQSNICRSAVLFDTSFLCGALPTAGTLSVYGSSTSNTAPAQQVRIVTSNPESDTSMALGDFDSFGTTVQSDTSINVTSISTSAYNDFALNAAGLASVATEGITKFGMRLQNDISNSAPGLNSGTANALMWSADQSGTTNDPKLTLTYTEVPCSGGYKPKIIFISSLFDIPFSRVR